MLKLLYLCGRHKGQCCLHNNLRQNMHTLYSWDRLHYLIKSGHLHRLLYLCGRHKSKYCLHYHLRQNMHTLHCRDEFRQHNKSGHLHCVLHPNVRSWHHPRAVHRYDRHHLHCLH